MIDSIEVRERTNSRGQTYPQWFDSDGKMVGCGCDEAKAVTVEKYGFLPCKHRMQHNDRQAVLNLAADNDPFFALASESITGQDVTPHIEDVPLRYEGCDYCGRNHTSWNCPF